MEQTLWEGTSQTFSGAATGGRGASKYRLTDQAIYVESGLFSTSSEQIPLVAVADVDLKQSMTQKARNLGDVLVHVIRSNGARETMVLAAISDPRGERTQVNAAVHAAQALARQQAGTHHYTSSQAASAAAPEISVIDQLRQLGELRDAGVVSSDEFEAKKAELLKRL